MKTTIILIFLALTSVACKRRPPPAPALDPTPVSVPAPVTTPTPVGGGRFVAGDQNLPAINSALKAYIAKYKKPPTKLDDLAKEGLIPFIPMAPPGGRYELDAARGEVKFVGPMVK